MHFLHPYLVLILQNLSMPTFLQRDALLIKYIPSILACKIWEKKNMGVNDSPQLILQHYVALCKSQAKRWTRKDFVCSLVSSSCKEDWKNKWCTDWFKPEPAHNWVALWSTLCKHKHRSLSWCTKIISQEILEIRDCWDESKHVFKGSQDQT